MNERKRKRDEKDRREKETKFALNERQKMKNARKATHNLILERDFVSFAGPPCKWLRGKC